MTRSSLFSQPGCMYCLLVFIHIFLPDWPSQSLDLLNLNEKLDVLCIQKFWITFALSFASYAVIIQMFFGVPLLIKWWWLHVCVVIQEIVDDKKIDPKRKVLQKKNYAFHSPYYFLLIKIIILTGMPSYLRCRAGVVSNLAKLFSRETCISVRGKLTILLRGRQSSY